MHPVGPAAGISGDIKVTNSGATVQVNNNDTQNNSVVAGFYGANSTSEPQGLAATWCKTRPWASNFLGKIIPTTFFDSLCTLRGFPVGQLAPTRPGTARPIVRPQPRPTTTTVVASTSTRPYIPPEVNIWAVPSKVPLGARTNIYWNTKGVDTCTEASPDGSFTQNSLSGGAATVPLSGPTTYTISCITPSGDHVTNYATVNMSI